MGEPSTEILVRAIRSPASGPGSTLRDLFAESERGHEILTRQTQSRRGSSTVQVNYQPDSVMSWINQIDQHFNNVELLRGRIICGMCDDSSYGAATKPIVKSSWARTETVHLGNNISAAGQTTANLASSTPERAMHVAKVIEVRQASKTQENYQSFAQADSKVKEAEALNASTMRVPQEPRFPLGALIARETATSWVSRYEEEGCLASPARNRGTETGLAMSGQPVHVHSVVATVSTVQREPRVPPSPLDSRKVAARSGQVSDRIKQFETVATGRVLQERPQQLGALLAQERAMCSLKEDNRVVPIKSPSKTPNFVQQAPVMQVKVLDGAANPHCQEPRIQLGVLLAEEFARSRAGSAGLTTDAGTGDGQHMTSSSQGKDSNDALESDIQDESVKETTNLVHSQLHLGAMVARDLATSTSQESNQVVFPEAMGGVLEWVQRETQYQPGALLAAEVQSSCAQSSGVPTEGGHTTFWSGDSTVGESDRIMQVEPVSATTRSVIPKPQSSLGELIAKDAIVCADQQNKRGMHNIVFTTAANSIRQLRALTAQEVATSCVRGSGVRPASRTGDEGVSPASIFKERDGCTQPGSVRDTTSPVVQQPPIQLRALIADELATSTGNFTHNDEIMHVKAVSETLGPRFQEPESRVGAVFAQEVASSSSTTSGTDTGGEGFAIPAAHADMDVQDESSTEIQQEPRLQLGALLEKTRGEHGWLPLGRSPIGTPLLFRNQSSSVGNSRFDTRGMSQQGSPVLSTINPPSMSNSRLETGGVSLGCSFLSRNHSFIVGSSRYEATEPSLNLETLSSHVPQVPGDLPIQPQLIHSTESEVIFIPSPAAAATAMTEERPPNRVSLMSLLNQDMDLDETESITSGVNPPGNQCVMEEVDEGQASEELDPMCCVCMVGHKGAAFIPCGHTFCRKCCREVRRSLGTCPLCNRDILDILDIY